LNFEFGYSRYIKIITFDFIGPLNTLVQVLLTTIFDLEEDEEADMKDSHISGLLFSFFLYLFLIYIIFYTKHY